MVDYINYILILHYLILILIKRKELMILLIYKNRPFLVYKYVLLLFYILFILQISKVIYYY